MFCDFLLAFRVLQLIKPEASLKRSSQPKVKYSVFVFAWNSPPNTFACNVCNELTCQSEDRSQSWCFTGPEQQKNTKYTQSLLNCLCIKSAKLLSLQFFTLHLLSLFPPYTTTLPENVSLFQQSWSAVLQAQKGSHLSSLVCETKEGQGLMFHKACDFSCLPRSLTRTLLRMSSFCRPACSWGN